MQRPQKRHKQDDSPDFPLLQPQDETPGLPTGAHKKKVGGAYTMQRLESCERVFCSQSLATPYPGELESIAAEQVVLESQCGSDFSISYSQHYTRGPSQRLLVDEEENGAGPSSWESSATAVQAQLRSPPHIQEGVAAEAGNDRLSIDSRSIILTREDSTTPELHPEPTVSKEATKKLFPLFRPKSQWKTLHIIRHGESEFNAACNTRPGFGDPQVFDPKLTSRGRKQAEKLREKLAGMKISKEALWVVSPMTRALETMLLACPLAAQIGSSDNPLKTAVRQELAEQCQSTGDIGLPISYLLNNFPQFSSGMKHIPERWWFKHMENDALQRRLLRHESKAQLRLRVGEFRKWVQAQPEKVIVAFGHHCVFKELTNGQKGLKNCEVHTMCL